MKEPILGWKIDSHNRTRLLGRFPPHYPRTVADHVTYGRGGSLTLPDIASAQVVGRADDGEGVEALVVALAGSIDRPTGGTYHVTWSLGPGRQAKESNDVIARHGWQPVEDGGSVKLEPARWP